MSTPKPTTRKAKPVNEMAPEQQPAHTADCDEQHGPESRCNTNAYTVEHDGDVPEPEPTPEEPPPPPLAAGLARYVVNGSHAVDGVPPGRVVDLDPDEPRTERLSEQGHIVPAGPTQQED